MTSRMDCLFIICNMDVGHQVNNVQHDIPFYSCFLNPQNTKKAVKKCGLWLLQKLPRIVAYAFHGCRRGHATGWKNRSLVVCPRRQPWEKSCVSTETAVEKASFATTPFVFFVENKRISLIEYKYMTTEHQIACPPDTLITCPVSILACSLAKNRMVSAMSSGWISFPIGISGMTAFSSSLSIHPV